ncbi:acyl-CoA dehydrogenase family protein [Paenibacillus athensensis]|uniref:Acyl-CoA dehydrogenase n=1 Tax=Paenibacillus athensensis TaxID=1967502 RepID=A0A4Y8QAM9_9BACL|nr:acyl-CoA dehydrogenase family protein [Paenibacillus athensensis]MCD1257508.1 acyl-CoA dehydrogenase family protein [Paenibacillus athensensis]
MNAGKIVGGSFVFADMEPGAVTTPEDLTAEQRLMAETTRQFVDAEVLPHDERLEGLDYELTVSLMRKAGELGLLGADVPDAYGGLGLDKISSTLISETLASASSFALSVGAHVGIGTLPIVFFGNVEQKERYLPELAAGTKIAAYCLTEPSSGSDALGAKTTARLSEDGSHYILNGSKLYITNAGFADLFIVYAKINGADFSAFIVERDTPGFTFGPEEKKMGIKGSSTRPLFFDDAPVPADRLLGQIGKGHLIAFNILNIGRFKLAAGCLGAAKEAIALSARFANQRKQFGTRIARFPLVAAKLADMQIRTFVLESMVYRTAGLMDDALSGIDYTAPDAGQQAARAIGEYAIECSINKVFASEALDRIADEGVQIHGGCGYIQEYRIERIYRDSRINRIFEGTNEINRLLIPGTLLKKALKGELPLLQKAQELQAELLALVPAAAGPEGTLAQEKQLLAAGKKLFLLVGGLAVQRHGAALERQQEVLAALADMMIELYACESALQRTLKRLERFGEEKARFFAEMTTVYIHEAFERMESSARQTLAALEQGDALRTQLAVVRKLTRRTPADTVALKRLVAAHVSESEAYTV